MLLLPAPKEPEIHTVSFRSPKTNIKQEVRTSILVLMLLSQQMDGN